MLTPKEKANDILDALLAVVEFKKVPILEAELRRMAGGLVQYHTAQYAQDLFRVIHATSSEAYFPSAAALEQKVRERLGLPITRGVTEDKIDRFERENVLAGQSPKNAKAGAEMMRATLRKAPIPAEPVKIRENPPVYASSETAQALALAELDAIEVEYDPLAELDSI